MQYRVYKSLDKPSVTLGLKGSYLLFFVVGGIAGAFLGVMIGSILGSLMGFIVFVLIGGGSYLGTLAFQSKFSEKERFKWMNSWKNPDFIRMSPRPFRSYLKNNKSTIHE